MDLRNIFSQRGDILKFCDKLKKLRTDNKISQVQLAEAIGVSARTIQNYETANMYPKNRDIYKKLSDMLNVDVNYLLTEDEEFITEAQTRYGTQGKKDALELVSQLAGMFAGGELSEEARDEAMQALQNAYWAAKKENKKYIPKNRR